jgi:hypothetical protein
MSIFEEEDAFASSDFSVWFFNHLHGLVHHCMISSALNIMIQASHQLFKKKLLLPGHCNLYE